MSWNPDRSWPSNWTSIRLAVLSRDGGWCRIAGPECTGSATEVDHVGARDDHRMVNLQAVCARCHQIKTQEQQRAYLARKYRSPEPHPGGAG